MEPKRDSSLARKCPQISKNHPLGPQMGPRHPPMAPNPHFGLQNVFLAGFHHEHAPEKEAAHNGRGRHGGGHGAPPVPIREKVFEDFFRMGIHHASDRLGLARRIQCASAVPATVLSERSRTLHFAPQTAPGPSILHPKRSLSPPFCTPQRSLTLHFAPQSAQMQFLSIVEAILGQKGVQHGSLLIKFRTCSCFC